MWLGFRRSAWLVYVIEHNVIDFDPGAAEFRKVAYSGSSADVENLLACYDVARLSPGKLQICCFASVMRPALSVTFQYAVGSGFGFQEGYSVERADGKRLSKDERALIDNFMAGRLRKHTESLKGGVLRAQCAAGSFCQFVNSDEALAFVAAVPDERISVAIPLSEALVESSLEFADTVLRKAEECVRLEMSVARGRTAMLQDKVLQDKVLQGQDSAFLLRILDKERLVQLNVQTALEKQLMSDKLAAAADENESLREEVKLLKHQQDLHVKRAAAAAGPRKAGGREESNSSSDLRASFLLSGDGRELVEAIRMKRGLGYREGTAERGIVDGIMEIVGHALQVIARDIYTSSHRCFFELLQNADDLRFGADAVPTFRIQVFPNGVLISNNELEGFSKDDIVSICGIGQSTKKQSDDSTGRKGIGFKSVFKLTARPEIWSGSYQILFDSTQLGGAILPEWIDSVEAPVDFPAGFITHIWLPLSEVGEVGEVVDALNSHFKHETLLFLRRIREIVIVTEGEVRLSMNVPSASEREVVRVSGNSAVTRSFFMVAEGNGRVQLAFPDPSWFAHVRSSALTMRSVPWHSALLLLTRSWRCSTVKLCAPAEGCISLLEVRERRPLTCTAAKLLACSKSWSACAL